MSNVSNSDDIIDSRDVITRIEELRAERAFLTDELEGAAECVRWHHNDELCEDGQYIEHAVYRLCRDELAAWVDDNAAELAALESLASECEGYGDWEHGATLIRESHFEDYVRELAESIHGAVIRNASWPFDCIDWEQAAAGLRHDYMTVEYDGVEYLMRA